MQLRVDVGAATRRKTYGFSNHRGELFLSEPFISPSTGEQLIGWMVDSWPDQGIDRVEFMTREQALHFIEVLLGEPIPLDREIK